MTTHPDLEKRRLIEDYFRRHDFADVQSQDEINVLFCMSHDGRSWQVSIEREWLRLTSNATIEQRLDRLKVIPFLRTNFAAWIGVTAAGQEVITHMEPGAKP